MSERYLVFPAALFERVFKDLLPRLQQRPKRPLQGTAFITRLKKNCIFRRG